MVRCDALIVGGGPAGSTCACILRRAGWQVLVMDRARFPRDKVCAGWVTPGVFRLLDLDPSEYRATGLTIQDITGFRTSVMGDPAVETRYDRTISYAIRRCEFDAFLLNRSGAEVLRETPLESLERRGGEWVANDTIAARVVIGAGGHFCPVSRILRGERSDGRPVVAKEAEFRLEGDESHAEGHMPELFFCRDLEGYGWCVRKGRYLNIGLGRRENGDLNPHIHDFMAFLERNGLARRASFVRWRGHAYLASGTGPRPLIADGMLVVGDSAGLAYPESGEGIKPAVESGRLAAETLITAQGRAGIDDLKPYEAELRRRYPPAPPTPAALAGITKALGRRLMRSPWFTRRVVIDRWFLRNDKHEGHEDNEGHEGNLLKSKRYS
jgi:geranylgeranyl reductase family protein